MRIFPEAWQPCSRKKGLRPWICAAHESFSGTRTRPRTPHRPRRPKEAHKLKEKQDRIKEPEHKLRCDGKLSAHERARLKKELDDLGAQIRSQKHDKQKE